PGRRLRAPKAQPADRQEHPRPRETDAGRVAAGRRAPRRAQPQRLPGRGRWRHASVRRDLASSESQARAINHSQHRRAWPDVSAGASWSRVGGATDELSRGSHAQQLAVSCRLLPRGVARAARKGYLEVNWAWLLTLDYSSVSDWSRPAVSSRRFRSSW